MHLVISTLLIATMAALLYFFGLSSVQDPPSRLEPFGTFATETTDTAKIELADLDTFTFSVAQDIDLETEMLIRDQLREYLQRFPLPASLADVDIDGELKFDNNGNLIQSFQLKLLFDQLLTLQGEWDEQAIRIWLQGYAAIASSHLSADVSGETQIVESYDRYVSYLKEATQLMPDVASTTQDELQNFKHLSTLLFDLRREHLGQDVADNFFLEQESYDQSQLKLAALKSDESLTGTELQEELLSWQNSLNNEQKLHLLEEQKFDTLKNTLKEMLDNNASASEVFTVRETAYGNHAAQRLAALDVTRAQWQTKLDSYQIEYANLVSDDSLSEEDVQSKISIYISANFTSNERKRLPRYRQ